MLLIGLTGGIGSGKSTVANIMGELGAIVFDADKLAREAVELGTRGYVAITEVFGPEVLLPGGEIDRPALARRVFANDIERRELEAVLHPEIFRIFEERIAPFRDGDGIVVFDAPLLIESGYDQRCDMVVLVEAPEEMRVRRVIEFGRSEQDVRSRMAVQTSDEVKAFRSDAVIQNLGTLDELREQVEQLWMEIERRAKRAAEEK